MTANYWAGRPGTGLALADNGPYDSDTSGRAGGRADGRWPSLTAPRDGRTALCGASLLSTGNNRPLHQAAIT